MSKQMQVDNQDPLPADVDPDEGAVAAMVIPAPFSAVLQPVSSDIDPDVELDEMEHRAWRSFLIAHARVARRLEADLLAKSDLPLAEFDVLFQLDLADGHRLRMNELANRVVLSRAGITRLVDRLVADDLVGRLKCDADARGAYAVLTEKGRLRLNAARSGHFAAVRRHFLAAFARPELETLSNLLDRSFPLD